MAGGKDTYIRRGLGKHDVLVTKPRSVLQMFLAGSAVFGGLFGVGLAMGVQDIIVAERYPVGAWWIGLNFALAVLCAVMFVGFLYRHAQASIPPEQSE